MEFSLFLSCYFPDTTQPAARMYGQMLEMGQAAEQLGFCGVTVPEHHMINILMNPNPLTLAVKVASVTERIPITAAVVVLPLHDMRRLAAEIGLADILTEGRIQIGAGRGAFPYEFIRFGVPFEKSREIFDESLEVLQALIRHDHPGGGVAEEQAVARPRDPGEEPVPQHVPLHRVHEDLRCGALRRGAEAGPGPAQLAGPGQRPGRGHQRPATGLAGHR